VGLVSTEPIVEGLKSLIFHNCITEFDPDFWGTRTGREIFSSYYE
jgi:hypothetical protein